MRIFLALFTFVLVAVVSIGGCQGRLFTQPPYEIFNDMDRQAKVKPQQPSNATFHADGRGDRPVVPGTVPFITVKQETYTRQQPRDAWHPDRFFVTGVADGQWGRGFPAPVVDEMRSNGRAFLELGQQKFNIYCSVCHGASGNGQGVASRYEWSAIANLTQGAYLGRAEGDIYNTIVNGKNTMGPYGSKLNYRERWAIVAYVRALQRAANATLDDVPPAERAQLSAR